MPKNTGVNFINILQAIFLPLLFCQKIQTYRLQADKKFKEHYRKIKAAHKMLITQGR